MEETPNMSPCVFLHEPRAVLKCTQPNIEIFVSTLFSGVSLLSSYSDYFLAIYDAFALPSKLFSLAE